MTSCQWLGHWPFFLLNDFCQWLGHPLLGPTELVITFDLHKIELLPPSVPFALQLLKCFVMDEGRLWGNFLGRGPEPVLCGVVATTVIILIVSTSGIGIAKCGKLIAAVVTPRLRHPGAPLEPAAVLNPRRHWLHRPGRPALVRRLEAALLGPRNGVRVWLTSRRLGLLREGEKFSGATSSSLPSSSCVIRLVTGRAALWAAALTAEGDGAVAVAPTTGARGGRGLRSLPGGLCQRSVPGLPGAGVGQEQPVGLFHGQVFRLGKQGGHTSPLTGSPKGSFLPCGCIFLRIWIPLHNSGAAVSAGSVLFFGFGSPGGAHTAEGGAGGQTEARASGRGSPTPSASPPPAASAGTRLEVRGSLPGQGQGGRRLEPGWQQRRRRGWGQHLGVAEAARPDPWVREEKGTSPLK